MITFTDEQNRAIDAIVEWFGNQGNSEFYLAGYAGTGKSTVCAEATARIKSKYPSVVNVPTGAYTGKAAHVLRKKGNYNAQTIHSMIYGVVEDPLTGDISFTINPLGTAAIADLIVLDECSMIDQVMANDLRSFSKKTIIMGDPGQLPPINGVGEFIKRVPDFFLQEIHRQAQDSPIIELATMARKGIALPIGYHKDNVRVMALTNENAENIHNPDTQVLCGLNRVRWAVTALMRERLGFKGEHPQQGERIMCCKNNKTKGLFNGGAGILSNLEIKEDGSYFISGEVEGQIYKNLRSDPYLFRQHFNEGTSVRDFKKKYPNEFDWSYIISCHKAQGSEWEDVTMIDDSKSFREDANKWLYTAITRASKNLLILTR